MRAAAERPPRWTLSRAGIINVYQYGDEMLHFEGGRLLLRGVNGSGKSTAMSMLLPFLLDADTRRIDAAGEQSGVLKTDAHPKGVRAKSRFERVVDLYEPATLTALNEYVLAHRPADGGNPFVFLVGGRGQCRAEPLSYAPLAKLFSNVPPRWHP
jgi:hypothetical protein